MRHQISDFRRKLSMVNFASQVKGEFKIKDSRFKIQETRVKISDTRRQISDFRHYHWWLRETQPPDIGLLFNISGFMAFGPYFIFITLGRSNSPTPHPETLKHSNPKTLRRSNPETRNPFTSIHTPPAYGTALQYRFPAVWQLRLYCLLCIEGLFGYEFFQGISCLMSRFQE